MSDRPDPRVFLIDASIYIFRAYFSVSPDMTDARGAPVNALHGFADFLGRFLYQASPGRVAVAFDESLTSSFRNELYPDYKANRELPPEDLERQLTLCRELVERTGICQLASSRYEADDLIGTLAAKARGEGLSNVILTADKDLAQLLREGDHLWDFAKDRWFGVEDIPDWLGVEAHQVADRLAITGDSVDNIPGVPGIGPKGAAALLAHFGDLDSLYARIAEVPDLKVRGAARLQKLLIEHEAQARLARRLTGIVEDAELDSGIDALEPVAIEPDALLDWCMDVGIGGTAARRLARTRAT